MIVGIAIDSFSTARQAIVPWKVRGVIESISQIVLRKQFVSLTLTVTMVAFDIDFIPRHVL
jgi:hypothetical protein